ncbi:MAG: M48 family metalloprotease [Verrucomicrobiota bacterium]
MSTDYSFLAALNQPVPRNKTGVGYFLCLVLVTFTMLLLPVIYLGFIVGLSWAVYHHAFHNFGPIMHLGGFSGGRLMIVKLLIYVAPLLAGVVVVFFMFKPLLAGRPKRAQPLALNPSDNPLLYAFIAKICDAVGAPSPKRIDLDCELNASASFRRGLLSLFSNDLVLTIGLPLVANLTARELAGVIAHEFGHFTQGAGMRLSYIIRAINFWFARVAYQRDAWDETLEEWAADVEDGRVAIVVWTVQLAVFFSRLLLKLLLFTGHIISGFMLRQMEYDADLYEIKVAGSEAFESTMRKLATLGAALEITYRQIHANWKKSGRLPDNLAELLRQAHTELPADVLQKIDDTLGFHRTSLFDSHPSPADRIRRARQAADPGIFHDSRPAVDLFSSFDHPARFVTLLHYTDDLDIPISPDMLLRVETKRPASATAPAVATNVCKDYFLGVLPLLMPLRIQPPVPAANYESAATELQQLSAGLQQIAAQLDPIASQYAEASGKRIKARAAIRLAGSGASFQPGSLDLGDDLPATAEAMETETAGLRQALKHSLHEVSDALGRRLQLGLSLKLSERGDDGDDGASRKRLLQLVEELNSQAAEYDNHQGMAESLAVLNLISSLKDPGGETPAFSNALLQEKESLKLFSSKPATPSLAPASGHLQIAKPSHVNANELDGLRKQNREWLADYHAKLEELVAIALSAEQLTVA